MNFYTHLHSKKRPWQPTCGTKQPVAPGSENTLARCLALRCLEIPVQDWVAEGAMRERSRLSSEAIALLTSNCEDELKHDRALTMAATAYGLGNAAMDAEAQSIAAEWLSHPDHPLVKAATLEQSVFFVILPLMRQFGGAGLRNISRDISTDESIHAPANRQAAEDLGYRYSPSLDALRERTVRWLVDDLNAPGKLGLPEVWVESSKQLLASGRTSNLDNTRSYVMPAFFEHSASDLPVYY